MGKNKILAFLIAILPVAYIYSFPVLINNLGNAILIFLIFPLLLLDYKSPGRQDSKYIRPYLFFSLYLIAVSALAPAVSSFSGDTKELFSAVEFAVIMYFLIANKNLAQSFIEIYTILSLLFSILLFVQYAAFVLGGIVINGAIPFLEIYTRGVESVTAGRILRLSSVFLEPSHFAVYVVPAILMYLFDKTKQKGKILKVSILTIACLLSTSANGIIVLAIVFFAFIIYRYHLRIRISHLFIIGFILVAAVYVVSNSKFMNDVTYGLFVQEADMTTSKAELRIYRGFKMYADLPLDKQIFGIGWRNARAYCQTCNTTLYGKYAIDAFDYFNSIAGTLIYSGIIGLTFLLMFFWRLWQRTSDFGTRTMIICILALMSSSSVLMSDQWVYFLAVIISLMNKQRNEESIRYSVT